MSKTLRPLLAVLGFVAVAACSGGGGGGGSGGGAGAGTCTGVPSGASIASCTTGVPDPQQCLEFIGAFWNATTAAAACTEAFSTTTTTCPTTNRLGRCVRNCGRAEETVESFYDGGPFTATSAKAVCDGYAGGDPVAPIFIPEP